MVIGISKKIKMQIETLKYLGFDVYYSKYTSNGVAICHDEDVVLEKTYRNERINNYMRRFRLLALCRAYLSSSNKNFDLGFIRWDPVDSLFLSVLKCLDKSCKKVLMDFHGYFPEYAGKGIKGKYTQITTKINGNKMSKYVDFGLVELKDKSVFGIKTLPTDTSINVDNYSEHRYCGPDNEINMVSVSNETAYHGYDRIISGLYQYQKEGNSIPVRIHLVGKMSDKTIQMISKLGLKDDVILYGYKTGTELTEIYNHCNLAIGPLAPHRVGGKQGTGIKTKEYFAIGIPYFYAGNELLVPRDYKYAMQIEANDEPININNIIEFYNSVRDVENLSSDMRAFAREHFSCEKTFRVALTEIGLL